MRTVFELQGQKAKPLAEQYVTGTISRIVTRKLTMAMTLNPTVSDMPTLTRRGLVRVQSAQLGVQGLCTLAGGAQNRAFLRCTQ